MVNPDYFFRTLPWSDPWLVQSKVLDLVKQVPDIFYRRLHINLMRLTTDLVTLKAPELFEYFERHGYVVNDVLVFVMWHQEQCGIHKDTYPAEARINIPLLNCEGSRTEFYSDTEPSATVRNGRNEPFEVLVNQQATPVCGFELVQPSVMRVRSFHRVFLNPEGPRPRITLSVGTKEDPVALLSSSPFVL